MLTTCNISFGKRIVVGENNKIEPDKQIPFEKASLFMRFVNVYCNETSSRVSSQDLATAQNAAVRYILRLHSNTGLLFPSMDSTHSTYPEITGRDKELFDRAEEDFRDRSKETALKMDRYKNEYLPLYETIKNIPAGERAPLDTIIKTYELYAKNLPMEINLESGRLDEIAKSDENTIFVLNHGLSPYDVCMGSGFIAELYKKYQEFGKAETCPQPRLLVQKHAVNYFPKELTELFTKVGTVPVDGNIYSTEDSRRENGELMRPVNKDFVANKVNLLIFPAGRRQDYKGQLTHEEQFQCGIARIILKSLIERREKDLPNQRIKVVSLGMAHENDESSMNIGKPIYFKLEGDKLLVSKGNISSKDPEAKNNSFFKKLADKQDNEFMPVCYRGEELTLSSTDRKTIERVIAGILFTDLKISAREASEKIC